MKENKTDKNDLIICDCYNESHQIIIRYDDDPDWEEVFVSYHLDNGNFLYRLKNAIKYIFGYRSRYGDFGELIIPPTTDSVEKLQNVVNKLKKVKLNNEMRQREKK